MAFSDSSSCYLAIPASDDFASVRQTVKEAVEEFQIEPLEQTVSSAGGSVRTSARELLGRADFVIADVTVTNANILYELGIANALRKPILLMSQQQVELPGDLARQQLLLYKVAEMPELGEFLRYWIRDALSLRQPDSVRSYLAR